MIESSLRITIGISMTCSAIWGSTNVAVGIVGVGILLDQHASRVVVLGCKQPVHCTIRIVCIAYSTVIPQDEEPPLRLTIEFLSGGLAVTCCACLLPLLFFRVHTNRRPSYSRNASFASVSTWAGRVARPLRVNTQNHPLCYALFREYKTEKKIRTAMIHATPEIESQMIRWGEE